MKEQLRNADPVLRARAVANCGKARDATTVEHLGRLLESDGDREVRLKAAWALGQIGNRRALPFLLKTASSEDERVIRHTAITAIGELHAPEAIDGLIAQARKVEGADDGVLWHSVRDAIIGIGPTAQPALLTALHDEAPSVRRLSVMVLARIGDDEALNAAASLQDDPDMLVRSAAQRRQSRSCTTVESPTGPRS